MKSIIEIKDENDVVTKVEYDKDDIRELVGYQGNVGIMSDCIDLLEGNQIYCCGNLYRLISGKKPVIDIFEEYSKYFIEAINDEINEGDLWSN